MCIRSISKSTTYLNPLYPVVVYSLHDRLTDMQLVNGAIDITVHISLK